MRTPLSWAACAAVMLGAANVAWSEDAPAKPKGPEDTNMIQLVVEDGLFEALGSQIPPCYQVIPRRSLDAKALVDAAGAGKSVVWIGDGKDLPKDLSVGAFRPSETALATIAADSSPLAPLPSGFKSTTLYSAFISPPKEMPQHNIDEEVRADFLPILEARDRLGRVIGYPGALMSHYAASLVGGRFNGSECFYFLFDRPLEALDVAGWVGLLQSIATRHECGVQVKAYETDYSSYRENDRVRVRMRLHNARAKAVATELRFTAKGPGDTEFRPITTMRRVANGNGETEAVCDFRPEAKMGLWTVRTEVCMDPAVAEKLTRIGTPTTVERRDLAFMVADEAVKTPAILSVDGPRLKFDGKEGFFVGTHYYPSSSWWEWVWRDFRPLTAARDLAAIRREGHRLVRVWVDPVLDEQVLRAMDVALQLAAENGIVLDICLFTQWTNKMGFERPNGEQVLFQFRDTRDFNLVSFSLRNLDLQREFVRVLAARWKHANNIVWDLANETYVKDPDTSQMDPEAVSWDGIPTEHGSVRDTALFRRWAAEMTKVIRAEGGKQPVFAGYMFSTMDGGDNTQGNADADIVPWHSYLPVDRTASTLQYMDPACFDKPLLLEEFGLGGWNNTAHYDADTHYALAAGAACAMSYEWGVSWLARESCYWPLPLREAMVDKPDPRWFSPFPEMGKAWSEYGVGLCATPSGLGYGSIYHGTPFPAPAAVALGRMGLMGGQFTRAVRDEKIYVIIPASKLGALEAVEKTLAELWREKAEFVTWQEAALDKLPASARLVICPGGRVGGFASHTRSSPAEGLADRNWTERRVEALLRPRPRRRHAGRERRRTCSAHEDWHGVQSVPQGTGRACYHEDRVRGVPGPTGLRDGP